MMTVKEMLDASGLTDEQVAVALDCTASAVYGWRKLKGPPHPFVRRHLAKLCHVKPDDVQWEVPSEPGAEE